MRARARAAFPSACSCHLRFAPLSRRGVGAVGAKVANVASCIAAACDVRDIASIRPLCQPSLFFFFLFLFFLPFFFDFLLLDGLACLSVG
mmetsp:Transcript_107665/g.231828  ORF Transcript_107665/g.231828 Transcript_107665/m.231828 type:complete len:90 (-) Transcript_107665:151-420(-)